MRPPTQAVILAAGSSARTHPLTVRRRNPLLPSLDKPLLQHTLEQLEGLVEEAILTLCSEREQTQRAFGTQFQRLRLRYCIQEDQLGTGHALLQAIPLVRGSFFVLNGDDLVHGRDLQRMREHRYAVLGEAVPSPQLFGAIEMDSEGYAFRIMEKPPASTGDKRVTTGAFVLQRDLFSTLQALRESARGEYELVNIAGDLPRGERCKVIRLQDYWLPLGHPWNPLEKNGFLLAWAKLEEPRLPGVSVGGRSQTTRARVTSRATIGDCGFSAGLLGRARARI